MSVQRFFSPLRLRLMLTLYIGACLCVRGYSQQNPPPPPQTGAVYDEAINYLSSTHGGGLTQGATIPLTYTPASELTLPGITPIITNIVSLKLNEEGSTYVPGNFSATVTLKIEYGPSASSITAVTRDFTITYSKDAGASYNAKQYLTFSGAKYVQVTIVTPPSNSVGGVPVVNLISVCNEMHIWRDYFLSPNESVTPTLLISAPNSTGVPDELPVVFGIPTGTTGHNGLQLEWAWVETEMVSLYTQGGSINYDQLFQNNSTRVNLPLSAPGYNIPLYYDGSGNLYSRVRLVNIQRNGTVSNGPWSAVQSYLFNGHNNNLNWQVATSYAEDGKRKAVMQYYDGTLRQRQTVTKDNSTNTTVTAETFYDGQGRPAIQILPTPGINNVVAYTQNLNLFNGQPAGSDPGVYFDLQQGTDITTPAMVNSTGAAQYYSPGNPEIAQNSNQNIPNAAGFPYTVTRYTPDATGRVMAQAGVGAALKMGSTHETQYFYGSAAQEELDGLFGTDAGDFSHYFKNMVKDANGQMNVSYVDMHGRTIATALAGGAPGGMIGLNPGSGSSQYPGQALTNITRNLLNGNANAVRGSSLESITSLLVPTNGSYTFHYDLQDLAYQTNPNNTPVCYSCLYDLEIAIADESGQQAPVIRKWHSVSLSGVGQCNATLPTLADDPSGGTEVVPNGNNIDFTIPLTVGSYAVRKTLTVDPAAYQQYLDDYLSKALPDINTLITNEYNALLPLSDCGVTPPPAACDACKTKLGTLDDFRASYLANFPAGAQPTEATIEELFNSELAHCDQLCSDPPNVPHLLVNIESQMLADMIPGAGQYAKYPLPTTNPLPTMYSKYDIFSSTSPGGQAYYLVPENSSQNPDSYYDAAGSPVSAPTNPDDFANQFSPSWASALLPHHPEYAKLQYAKANLVQSYKWIETFNGVTTYDQANTNGYIGNTATADPFFSLDAADQSTMVGYQTTSYAKNMSMWQLAYVGAVCNTKTDDAAMQSCLAGAPTQPPSSSDAHKDQIWNLYKAIYSTARMSMLAAYLDRQVPNADAQPLVDQNYILRFPITTDQLTQQFQWSGLPSGDIGDPPTANQDQLNSDAKTYTCSGYINAWTDALSNCPVLNGRSDKAAILAEITAGMEAVCEKGIDQANPLGSSSVAPGTPQDGSPRDFAQVIDNVFLAHGLSPAYKDQLCNPFLITAPKQHGENQALLPPGQMGGVDQCACDLFSKIKQDATAAGYNPAILTSLNTYLNNIYGETLSQAIFDALGQCGKLGTQLCSPYVASSYQSNCEDVSNPCTIGTSVNKDWLPDHPEPPSPCHFDCVAKRCMTITYIPLASPQPRPSFLVCGFTGNPGCFSCSQLSALTTSYKAWFQGQACAAAPILDNGSLTADQIGYNVTYASYLNYYTGLNLSWNEYLSAAGAVSCDLTAYASNSNATQSVVCAPTGVLTDPSTITVVNGTCDGVRDQAIAIAQDQYNKLRAKALSDFSAYIPYCLSAANEHFTVTYQTSEFHYTLYYYDQAGNLVRTVPPKGARPNFTSAFIASVESARVTAPYSPVVPAHVLVTDYRYNSLNSVVTQQTPDAGVSNFWYDAIGRLVVSQNAQQAVDENYSYTVYDNLGRITEVGQKPQPNSMMQSISQNSGSLSAWLNSSNLPKSQITRTDYDQPQLGDDGKPIDLVYIHPQNLRNRVSRTYTMNLETDVLPYANTYYTYDVHGNVDTLVQDFLGVPGMSDKPYKQICYDYDLVSGKVNGVDYQPGQSDAFYYRYTYDAENRLTGVKTSRDSIFWEDDARYFYYKHGPLEREVLGKLSVQGLDYSYTLQGWLKGVNIGNGFAGVMPDGTTCPPGSALADADISSRPATGGAAEYLALNSITFESGFQTYDNDDMETVLDPSLAVCTLPSGGGSGGLGGGGVGAAEGFPVAADAYNFSLHYYPNDYTAIGSTTPVVDVLQAMPSDAAPLYNGNIAAMAVNVPAVGEARVYNYHYDQLNRVAQMDAFKGLDMSSYTFTPVQLTDYQERVAYDPNGNIGTYLRNGFGSSLAMDNLTYNYNDNLHPNGLSSLTDGVTSSGYSTDLKGTTTYTYDLIGNLIHEQNSSVSEDNHIAWTVYGKIASVTNGSGTINYTYDAGGNRITKTVGGTTTLYVRDAQGNVLSIYTIPSGGTPQQTEVDLYGSNRLGTLGALTAAPVAVDMGGGGTGQLRTFTRGERSYELGNHLGNVLATVNDKKIAVSSDGSLIDSYKADVVTAQDYYPFGMPMPGRTFAAAGAAYRYGFNGKEKDDEVMGAGNQIDYGMRVYDPRAGRFLSVDPLFKKFPGLSSYQYASNSPIGNNDLDGLERVNYLLQWNQGHTIAHLTYAGTEDFTETTSKWTPTWSNWLKTTTTTVKNPRLEYVVHGQVEVPMGLDGQASVQATGTWTFSSMQKMQAAEGESEKDINGKSFSNHWRYYNTDQRSTISFNQIVYNEIQVEGETGGMRGLWQGAGNSEGRVIMYHYTNEEGQSGILESGELNPSLKANNPKDARYGDGQYLSDIVPGTKTPAQLSKAFLNVPYQGRRFTHYIAIDVTGLNVQRGRDGVYVIPNSAPLDLSGRIVGSGQVPSTATTTSQ